MDEYSFATVDEYRIDTGDAATPDERVAAELSRQSAKLRATLGMSRTRTLTGDAAALARDLVTDAARKKLVQPACAPMGVEDLTGVSQSSFTANGFQGSFTFQNPSGTAYFDRSTLTALKRLLGAASASAPCARATGAGRDGRGGDGAVEHGDGRDAMGEPTVEWEATVVPGCLVRPLAGSDAGDAPPGRTASRRATPSRSPRRTRGRRWRAAASP